MNASMKTFFGVLTVFAILAVSTGLAAAANIGVTFGDGNAEDAVANGFDGVPVWTPQTATNGANGGPVQITGAPATTTASWTADTIWRKNLATGTPPATGVYHSYLHPGNVSITLNGLNDWMAAESFASYTVRVYFSTDNGSQTFSNVDVKTGGIGGTIIDTIVPANYAEDQGSQAWGDSGTLTAATITLDPDGTSNDRPAGVALFGNPVPEPSTFALAGLGLLGLIGFGRRRQR